MAADGRDRSRVRDASPPPWLGLIEYPMIAVLGLACLALIWAVVAPTGHDDPPAAAAVDGTPPAPVAVDPFFRLGNRLSNGS